MVLARGAEHDARDAGAGGLSPLQAALQANRALQKHVAKQLRWLAAERDAIVACHYALVTTAPSASARDMLGVELPLAERRNERKPFHIMPVSVPLASTSHTEGNRIMVHPPSSQEHKMVWGSCLGYLEHAHRHSFLGRARSATQAINLRDSNEGRDPTRADHVAVDGLCNRYEPFCLAYAVCPPPLTQPICCDETDEGRDDDADDPHSSRRKRMRTAATSTAATSTAARRVTEVIVCAAPFSASDALLFDAQLQFPQRATPWTMALDAALVECIIQECLQRQPVGPLGRVVPIDNVRDFSSTDWIRIALTLRHRHVRHRKPCDGARRPPMDISDSNGDKSATSSGRGWWGPKDCLRFDGNTTASISGGCCRHRWEAVICPLLMLIPSGVVDDAAQQLAAAAASHNRVTAWSRSEDAALQKLLSHPSVQFLVCRPVWAKLEALLSTEVANTNRQNNGPAAGGPEAEDQDIKKGTAFYNTTSTAVTTKGEDGGAKRDAAAKSQLLAALISQATRRRTPFAIAARFQQHHNPYHLVSSRGPGLAATMRAALVTATTNAAAGIRVAKRRAALAHLGVAVQTQLPVQLPKRFTAEEDARLRWCVNNCGRHGSGAVHPGDLWVTYTLRTLSLCALEEVEDGGRDGHGSSGPRNRCAWGAAPFYSASYFFRSKWQVAARWLAIAAEEAVNDNLAYDASPIGICAPLEREDGGNNSSNATRQRGRVPIGGLVLLDQDGDALVVPRPLPHPTSWHDNRLKFLAAFASHALFALDAAERRAAVVGTAEGGPVVQRRDFQTVAVYVLDGIVSSRRLGEYMRFTRLDALGVLQGLSIRQQRQSVKSRTRRKPPQSSATKPYDGAPPPSALAVSTDRKKADVACTAQATEKPTTTAWNATMDGMLERLVEQLRVPWRLERQTPEARPLLTPSVGNQEAWWAQVAYMMETAAVVIAQQTHPMHQAQPNLDDAGGTNALPLQGAPTNTIATQHIAASKRKAVFTPRSCHARFAAIMIPKIFPGGNGSSSTPVGI